MAVLSALCVIALNMRHPKVRLTPAFTRNPYAAPLKYLTNLGRRPGTNYELPRRISTYPYVGIGAHRPISFGATVEHVGAAPTSRVVPQADFVT